MVSNSLDEFNDILFDCWIGYIYLYDEKTNKWLWDNYSTEVAELDLKPLDEYFKEYKIDNNLNYSNDDYSINKKIGGI